MAMWKPRGHRIRSFLFRSAREAQHLNGVCLFSGVFFWCSLPFAEMNTCFLFFCFFPIFNPLGVQCESISLPEISSTFRKSKWKIRTLTRVCLFRGDPQRLSLWLSLQFTNKTGPLKSDTPKHVQFSPELSSDVQLLTVSCSLIRCFYILNRIFFSETAKSQGFLVVCSKERWLN